MGFGTAGWLRQDKWDRPHSQTNNYLAQGTVLELGNAGSQLTKTSAIPAPASVRNECGPEFTIFIFN